MAMPSLRMAVQQVCYLDTSCRVKQTRQLRVALLIPGSHQVRSAARSFIALSDEYTVLLPSIAAKTFLLHPEQQLRPLLSLLLLFNLSVCSPVMNGPREVRMPCTMKTEEQVSGALVLQWHLVVLVAAPRAVEKKRHI